MRFLESNTVYLKKISIHDDLENYLDMVNDSENIQVIEGLGRNSIIKEDLIEFINHYNGKLFGIYNKQDEHVGNIGLTGFNNILRSCSYAILMCSRYKRKGYAFEGSVLSLNHAFNNLNLHRVFLGVVSWNESAIKLYEKLGFQREGIHRDAFWANGEYHNLYQYSLLKNEFKYFKTRELK